jgi:hypothetical protein
MTEEHSYRFSSGTSWGLIAYVVIVGTPLQVRALVNPVDRSFEVCWKDDPDDEYINTWDMVVPRSAYIAEISAGRWCNHYTPNVERRFSHGHIPEDQSGFQFPLKLEDEFGNPFFVTAEMSDWAWDQRKTLYTRIMSSDTTYNCHGHAFNNHTVAIISSDTGIGRYRQDSQVRQYDKVYNLTAWSATDCSHSYWVQDIYPKCPGGAPVPMERTRTEKWDTSGVYEITYPLPGRNNSQYGHYYDVYRLRTN